MKKVVGEAAKETGQSVVANVTHGVFQATDQQGRLVMVARVQNAEALVQPGNASGGPVTLTQADWTLYKEGRPSLWLKAPVATWKGGLLTASSRVRCGSIDGKITLLGRVATWAAKTNLLTVNTAGCRLRDPGHPEVRAAGPLATWQNGLLALPTGAAAMTVDHSASVRADRIRWQEHTHSLEATGHVRMSQGRLSGSGERLTGDTALRRFRLAGGRSHVTIFGQPAPLVVSAAEVMGPGAGAGAVQTGEREPSLLSGSAPTDAQFFYRRESGSALPHSKARSPGMLVPRLSHSLVAGAVALAVLKLPAARADVRQHVDVGSMRVDADSISGQIPISVHAEGGVVVTDNRTHDVLRADQVDVALAHSAKPAASSNRSPVQEAHATGHVQINSQPKPDEQMHATGSAGTYWPGTQKATLTGGVTVTMTSPQLEGPAVVTGSHADLDLAKRSAEVYRTESAPVLVKLHPKAGAAGGTASGAGAAGPIELLADRVLMENAANRITATGAPVLKGDQGTVKAERIWFDVDPAAKDIKTVHATGQVRIDAEDPQRRSFYGTSDEAVVNRDTSTAVMTGNVHGTLIQPDNPEPSKLQGDPLTYNFKTHSFTLGSKGEAQAKVSFKPKPKKPGPAPGTPGRD